MSKTTLIIHIPSYTRGGEYTSHMLQEKVFEYIKNKPYKYLKDYEIVFNKFSEGSEYIEEMIDDWDLDYFRPTNQDSVVEDIVDRGKGGHALIFYDFKRYKEDMTSRDMLEGIAKEDSIDLKVYMLGDIR